MIGLMVTQRRTGYIIRMRWNPIGFNHLLEFALDLPECTTNQNQTKRQQCRHLLAQTKYIKHLFYILHLNLFILFAKPMTYNPRARHDGKNKYIKQLNCSTVDQINISITI